MKNFRFLLLAMLVVVLVGCDGKGDKSSSKSIEDLLDRDGGIVAIVNMKDVSWRSQEEQKQLRDRTVELLERRIVGLGISEYKIEWAPDESASIKLTMVGVGQDKLKDILDSGRSLEFWETYDASELQEGFMRAEAEICEVLATRGCVTDDAKSQFPITSRLALMSSNGPIVGYCAETDKEELMDWLNIERVRAAANFPWDLHLRWSAKADNNNLYALYALRANCGRPALDGTVIEDARASHSAEFAEVTMTMNAQGIEAWSELTGANVGRCIAIVYDGYVYSAPVVNQRIDGGNSSITGDFTHEEAEHMALMLRSNYPVELECRKLRVVNPR